MYFVLILLTISNHHAMRLLLFFLLLTPVFLSAQKVVFKNETYKIKHEKIFKDGKDITAELDEAQKATLFRINQDNIEAKRILGEKDKTEKEAKKALKNLKKAEKQRKKAERELKKQNKAHQKFQDASKKLKKMQTKYEQLKRKGKLSPVEENKWLKKLEHLQKDVDKYMADL